MKPNIGIADKDRQGVVTILNTLLADEFVLYAKTRGYHWNVVGPDFSELHKLFEEQYIEIAETLDEVAERARALGGRALGSLQELIETTRLKEQGGDHPSALEMIRNLLTDHESIIQNLRQDLETCGEKHNDAGTSGFLGGVMEHHEKTAWMLRAYLDTGKSSV